MNKKNKRFFTKGRSGFTLIELVMVIILLGILAAVAIPNFIDFRTDAKNAATQGAIGAIRSALMIGIAAIQLKEDPTIPTPKYPTHLELSINAFTASHPILSAANTKMLDPAVGMPNNPWTLSTLATVQFNTIISCNSLAKSLIMSTTLFDYRGWCYKETTAEVWANSNLNSGGAFKTENAF